MASGERSDSGSGSPIVSDREERPSLLPPKKRARSSIPPQATPAEPSDVDMPSSHPLSSPAHDASIKQESPGPVSLSIDVVSNTLASPRHVPSTTATQAKPKKKAATTTKKDAASSSSKSRSKKASATKASTSTMSVAGASSKARSGSRSPSPQPNKDRVQEEEEEEDTTLYCICKGRFDDVEGGMIMCDRCDQWFHYRCMRMSEDDVELVDQFICPLCESQTQQRTTYKAACSRPRCKHAALAPFSKYCSERCGVLSISARMNAIKLTKNKAALATVEDDLRIRRARKVEGVTKRKTSASKSFEWLSAVQQSCCPTHKLASAGLDLAERFQLLSSTSGPSPYVAAALNGSHFHAKTCTGGVISYVSSALLSSSSSDEFPSPSMTCLLEQVANNETRLAELDLRKRRINASLDLLDLRSTLLHLVSDRVLLLPPVGSTSSSILAEGHDAAAQVIDADNLPGGNSKSKPSKKKKSADTSSANSGPRCGYDYRLDWDDEDFESWARSDTGTKILAQQIPLDGDLNDEARQDGIDLSLHISARQTPLICSTAKRKCKRHTDWSDLKELSFDAEKSALNEESQRISEEKLWLERCLDAVKQDMRVAQEMEIFEEQRRAHLARLKDEQIARMIASEGTRRSASAAVLT